MDVNAVLEEDKRKIFEYLRWNSYRSERYKIFYVSTPKVACTSIKWWFASLEDYAKDLHEIKDTEESSHEFVVHESHKVAPRVTGLLPEALSEALYSTEYLRFALVRNPYKRIFSAWQSKLLLQEPLQKKHYINYEFYNYPLKSRIDVAMAFEEFLEHLVRNEAPSYWDHHWTPQAVLLRPSRINYTILGKIENQDVINRGLAERLGEDFISPFLGYRMNESLIPYSHEFITGRSDVLIRALYSQDFDLFGYEEKVPDGKESFGDGQLDLAFRAIKLLRARHLKLEERGKLIAALRCSLIEHEEKVSALDGALTERDRATGERDQALTEQDRATDERDQALTELDRATGERDQALTELDRATGERDQALTELDRATDERDQALTELDRATDEHDQALTERDSQIASLRELVARFGGEKDRELAVVQLHLNEMLRSNSWRITAPLRRAATFTRQRRLPFLPKTKERLGAPEVSLSAVGSSVVHGAETNANGVEIDALKAELDVIRESGLFDSGFYLSVYPDLGPGASDPIRHYCERGWREGKNPSDDFDTRFYLKTYDDIRNAGVNPFWHYIIAGKSEQRLKSPIGTACYEADIEFGSVASDVKLLAFYRSPDWGTRRSGRPALKQNSQLFLPHEDLGLYDSSDWQVLDRQAQMAKRHGLYGFCFSIACGSDGSALPQPFEVFVNHKVIDFRFCLHVDLNPQGINDYIVSNISLATSDSRFVRIDGRPVIVITIPKEKQHTIKALAEMRSRLSVYGLNSYFLIGCWGPSDDAVLDAYVADMCDAILDLPSMPVPGETGRFSPLHKNGVDVVPYSVVAAQGVKRSKIADLLCCPIYHVVTLGRDDTARTPTRPLVYTNFNIDEYRNWLQATISSARATHSEDRRFVFMNSWNDWNSSLFLEPDNQRGYLLLNQTSRELLGIGSEVFMPKVSVVVTNYNHESFLRRRLNSIYGQTYKNIEVLLLDDCSSDNSRVFLDQYADNYPEITRRLYNDKNSGGVFRQWAKGIKEAKGDLIWIAESDDFCDRNFLEVLVRCFEDEAVMLAYAKCVFVTSEGAPMQYEFENYVSDLECANKWKTSYVETAHREVGSALGIKNTIPNASGVVFKRPINMPILDDEAWLSMRVAGDWVFYLHLIRGGKVAYSNLTTNFFRRYKGSAAESTYKKDTLYREIGMSSRTAQALYDLPTSVAEQAKAYGKKLYDIYFGDGEGEFLAWYDYEAVLRARNNRIPNVMVSTMGFYPGGAEILPIRLANEFKRQGLSVLLMSAGLTAREDGVRKMLRNDVPVVETSDVNAMKMIVREFGIEVLSTHHWYIQNYPAKISDVFDDLKAHVASLHGMIEHEHAFGVTEHALREADKKVTTWVYTADKNLGPFKKFGIYGKTSERFRKIFNGMQPPKIVQVMRVHMNIPDDAFVVCCVSRAIVDKGWTEAILAVEQARELSGRDIRLVLVGNGPVYDDLCQIGVPDFVFLAGFSANSVGHYAAADMGIMLTKFKSESFPLTIVDCLFAGRPYIASDVGDIRNMLTNFDGIAGDLIGLEDWEIPIDAVARVISDFASDKEKYQHAMTIAQNIVDRFRIDVVAKQYVDLFKMGRDMVVPTSESQWSTG
jgi:glycosyltransferase involved in cell wall biosynthesis